MCADNNISAKIYLKIYTSMNICKNLILSLVPMDISAASSHDLLFQKIWKLDKLDGVGPVDKTPSTN